MPFFIVSVPFNADVNSNVSDQIKYVQKQLSSCSPAPFEVPALKVGTLDSLMECSDDLFKIDSTVEAVSFKMLSALEEVSGTNDCAFVVPAGGQQRQEATSEYLCNFRWNEAQYPINKPVKQLLQSIGEQVTKGEENIRTRLADYNEMRTKRANINKKKEGSLGVKPLGAIVKQFYASHNEDGPIESEYMTTVFVAVPLQLEKQWLKTYATLGGCELVVPDSSKLLSKDAEYALYNVIVFRKIVDQFKHACRENKYVLRDYNAAEEMTDAELAELEDQLEQKKNHLIRWIRNAFSECYTAWIHLKAIRIFVESILKYGLPPKFVAMTFRATAKQEKDVRKQLASMYASLAPKKFGMEEDEAGGALEQQYPYVSLQVRASHKE
eukprot:NODE_322_length_1483_cov_868.148536_g233_i0.p1 GENE.NODE_322_length_1483_cov_868.148536_g233_i0~~NODE_322_length_1483_cov_868.148536_g233_i0.p1  ORF type:complete len:382 (-),score=144.41 NODE_322_length_1483_cov_868.148536_g233_i0:259-1404(-)